MTHDPVAELHALAASSPLKKIRVLAWRDLEDPEAGGSELHADEVLRRWADAGLIVDARTSAVAGRTSRIRRHGYFVERAGGRYQVFPQAILRGFRHDRHNYDAVVEIWNGIPFFGPVWFRGPRLTLIHHVHGAMWKISVPGPLSRVGWLLEHRIAPFFYRRSSISTLSTSSAEEIRDILGLKNVAVVPVGISSFFSPGGSRSETPLVVAVGRLAPVKRFDELIRTFAEVHAQVPSAKLVIAGEGYLRSDLEAAIAAVGGEEWISLPGRISDEELRDLYRSAWILTSNSLREGWGMTITEAAACGTPAVVLDIAGHRDAVLPDESGLLVPEDASLANALVAALSDPQELTRLQAGALRYAATFSWDEVALSLFRLLNDRAR